jgi:hypothetical protein
MGFFDKAKRLLGIEPEEDDLAPPASPTGGASLAASRVKPGARGKDRPDRPPLVDAPPPSQTIEDALELRDAGDRQGARKLLAQIDRGSGLRRVLRAAAALEDGDEDELAKLLPVVAAEAEGHRLLLQIAAALGDAAKAKPFVARAKVAGAPEWALAWTRAVAVDEAERRAGLVELLFADAALARTVAARDLDVGGAVADPEAAQRFASFSHGRDSIRRFGAESVAKLAVRALGGAA